MLSAALASTSPATARNTDARPHSQSSARDGNFGGDITSLPPGVPLPPGTQPGAQQRSSSGSVPAASEAQSDWSIAPSPNVTDAHATNYLTDVTCVSESDCWAVGASYRLGIPQTLVEHWDGTAWSIVASPNTVATKANVLSRVTCLSASDCWAVGWHRGGGVQQTLIEHWDGASWSIFTSPNTNESRSNLLTDVTCVSATDCWTVGYHHAGNAARTLIEHWDGTAWSIVTSPNTIDASNNFLSGVTCVSSWDCWAVGSTDGAFRALIEHWDGTSWSITPSPVGSLVPVHLASVTCTSASDCWAVGWQQAGANQKTLIVRWDGALWSNVVSPNASPLHSNSLNGVRCISASDCWAVGYANTGGFAGSGISIGDIVAQTLIVHWDGTSWEIVPSPNTSAARSNVLYGLACLSASRCWAVGYGDSAGEQTLVEQWDGSSWSIVASANVNAGQTANLLYGATCLSDTQCWAVGFFFNGAVYQTLIQRWDGATWVVVPSPNTSSTKHNLLTGVTCTSASNCWAVGSIDNSPGLAEDTGVARTLILRWNGTSWSKVASPNTSATQHNFLSSVTCASASDCWAVGSSAESGVGQTLIQRWNGTSWAIVPSPNVSPQGNILQSVACASGSECWAVGYYAAGGVPQTLIERWDGTSWAIVTSPATGSSSLLTGVTCVSASDCWAVGRSVSGGVAQTLIERWDGASWSIVTSPNTSSSASNFLQGVTCASASDCWAVGYVVLPGGTTRTLIDRWDGTSWAVATSPNHSAEGSHYLFGAACVSESECWAVGFHHNGIHYQTLILRNGPGSTEPSPTPTSSTATPTPTPTADPSPQPDIADVSITDNTAESGQHSDETLFEARLSDSRGRPIEGQELSFELRGSEATRSLTATTNEDGIASLTPRLEEKPGSHWLTVRFAGDEEHAGDADTASFIVDKEDSALDLTVEGEDEDKRLRAHLSDLDTSSEGIAGRTIDFYSDGELIGSGDTDTDGVASIELPPRHRGNNRTYEAFFGGDEFYLESSEERPGKGKPENSGGGNGGQDDSTAYGGKVLLM